MARSLKQSILPLLLMTTLGFFAGRLSAPKPSPEDTTPTTVIKEVPKEITKEIIREKVIIDPKSQEYYEKAFTLFLAAIGVRLSATQEKRNPTPSKI